MRSHWSWDHTRAGSSVMGAGAMTGDNIPSESLVTTGVPAIGRYCAPQIRRRLLRTLWSGRARSAPPDRTSLARRPAAVLTFR